MAKIRCKKRRATTKQTSVCETESISSRQNWCDSEHNQNFPPCTDNSLHSYRKRSRMVYKDVSDGSRLITTKNAGNQVLDGLRRLREERDMCDVIFKVGGEEVLAHRNILVISSEYFRAMFADGFHEMQARDITLEPASGIDRLSAETLVDFLYSGHLSVTSENVQGLIMAADHWQMVETKQMCVSYLERLIDTENCLDMLQFAETYRCEELHQKCLQVIKQRFPLVVQSLEFPLLSADKLTDILRFPDLSLGFEGENVILKAVMHWFSHNAQERLRDLPAILEHVRFTRTTRECRMQHLLNNPDIKGNREIQQVIQRLSLEPSTPRAAQTTFYVVGGFQQTRTRPLDPRTNSVECLDPVTGRWRECAPLPMKAAGSFTFSVFGHLFVAAFQPLDVGQRRAANVVLETDIYEYSVLKNEWLSARGSFSADNDALEKFDNCLQADGALAVCDRTNTVYTVSNSEVAAISFIHLDGTVRCSNVRLLPRARHVITEQHRLHSACVVDGRLFALGGDRHDAGTDPVLTGRVTMYDAENGRWVEKATMREMRARMAVAVLDGKVYASGGFNVRRLSSLERYDPATDTWTTLQPMSKYRSHHQLLVLQGKLWAIGGKSYEVRGEGAVSVLKSCEVYDPDTDTWTDGETMKSPRCGFSAVAV